MRALMISAAALALLQAAALPAAAQAAPASSPEARPMTAADSAAGRRLREVLALIDAGDRRAARAYVEAHYAPALLREVPVDAHLAELSQLHDLTRGMELKEVMGIEEGRAMARVRARLTETWWRFGVMVEEEPPFRVIGSGYGPDLPPAPTSRIGDAEVARDLEGFVRRVSGAGIFSGAVLVARDGKPVFQAAAGEANRDFGVPVTMETRFNLASMNKMFTAVAILQLAEAGKLSLQDPLSRHLPGFPTPEAAEKIRIEHLLTHTSGLGDFFTPKFDETRPTRLRTLDDYIAAAGADSLAFEPGTRWRYSNLGYVVLGKVIERASGQAYADYVREHVWKPAGMSSTDLSDLDAINPGLAVPYDKVYTDAGVTFRNTLLDRGVRGGPAGGGASTVGDLLRFAEALRGGKLVRAESLRLLTTPKPELRSPRYGYGFEILGEVGAVGHSGGTEGVSTNLDLFMEDGVVAVVLSNLSHGAEPVLMRVRDLVTATRAPAAPVANR
ncbi:MAG TPA: serine hydrolase domain-containing protein [Longimicrobium sp.]|nr:serine hydrolase domain-containing protein [Longimicrobium sp.]